MTTVTRTFTVTTPPATVFEKVGSDTEDQMVEAINKLTAGGIGGEEGARKRQP